MEGWQRDDSASRGMRRPCPRLRYWNAQERERGQALVEFSMVAVVLLVLVLGVVDFSRAIYIQQVITHLTREGSSLASRGTALADTVTAVINDSSPLNLGTSGYVIVTSVANTSGTLSLSQATGGGVPAGSRVWTTGNPSTTAVLPPGIPASGQTVYVTEVFYQFSPITPIGSLISSVLPSNMYDVAYF